MLDPDDMNELKALVGQAALQYVTPGEIVGVGTGSTVNKFIEALAGMKDRVPGAVSSSEASTARLRAIGSALQASAGMTHERLVEFPFWDDYKDLIKSEIADIKNIGGAEAGMITAGKFLEYFIDYPYVHLDIAGPAFLDRAITYYGKGGTGVGVRLLTHFLTAQSRA